MEYPINYAMHIRNRIALQVSMIRPKENKPGAMFLEIAEAVPNSDAFDWEKKYTLSLSVDETGHFLTVLNNTVNDCKFIHDSSKTRNGKGYDGLMKTGLVQRDRNGNLYFNLTYKKGDKINKRSIKINKASEEVLKALFNYAIPKLLRW